MGLFHNIFRAGKNVTSGKENQQTEEFVPQHVDIETYKEVLPYLRQDWLHTSNYVVSLWNRCSSWNTTGVVLCSAYFGLYALFHGEPIFKSCIFKLPYLFGWLSILIFFVFLALTELVKKTIALPSVKDLVTMLENSTGGDEIEDSKNKEQSFDPRQLFYQQYVTSLIKVDSEYSALYLSRMKYFRITQISAIVALVLLGYCFTVCIIGAI